MFNRKKWKKEWNAKNRDKMKVSWKRYREKNRDRINQYVKEYGREYRKKFPWVNHLTSARNRCKTRTGYLDKNIKCLLNIEDIKNLWFRDRAYDLKKVNIHRKDNNGNYTYNNCQFIEDKIHKKLHIDIRKGQVAQV